MVIVLLAVAVAILAWTEGNLRTTFIFGTVAVVQSVGTLVKARSNFRRREVNAIHHAVERTPRRRCIIILLRIFTLFMLICGIVGLPRVLVGDYPVYVILETILLIVFGGGATSYSPVFC